MQGLRHYWYRLFASSRKISPPDRDECKETPGHEIAILTTRNQALAEELGRLRTEFEQARSEEHRKCAELERRYEAGEAVRERDRNRLDGLERQVGARTTEHRQILEKVSTLELRLAGHSDRLDRADQQFEVLDAHGREQASACNAALSKTDARLGEAEDQVRSVELQLESTHQSLTDLHHEVRLALARQARRFNRGIAAAGVALLLGTAAGAILIRDVHHNNRIIAAMSSDMKELLVSFDRYLETRHEPLQPPPATMSPVPAAPETDPPPSRATTRTPVPPAARPAPVRETTLAVIPVPAPPWEAQTATPGKRDANRYFLGADLDLFLQMNNRGDPAEDIPRASANVSGGNAHPQQEVEMPGGLQYQVVAAGSGKTPTLGDRVRLDYLSSTIDGTIIDDTYTAGTPVTYHMAAVARGWQEVLLLMQEGAEWGVYVPPAYAQGGKGGSGLPGSEPGYYLIRLLEIVEGGESAQQP